MGRVTANWTFWGLVTTAGSLATLLIPAAIDRRRERLLRKFGMCSAGRVLELGRSDNDLGGSTSWARVEYVRDDGSLCAHQVSVRPGFGDYRVGQRVRLTYVPDRRIVRLDS
ncbi:MAG: hypothetical protein V7633_1961 [Pseudonocardia sp.]